MSISQLLSFLAILGSLLGAPIKNLPHHESSVRPTTNINQAEVELAGEIVVDRADFKVKAVVKLSEKLVKGVESGLVKKYILAD